MNDDKQSSSLAESTESLFITVEIKPLIYIKSGKDHPLQKVESKHLLFFDKSDKLDVSVTPSDLFRQIQAYQTN